MTTLGLFAPPAPQNEPVREYAPGSLDRKLLQEELARQKANPVEVPVIIGGKEIKTGLTQPITSPHDRSLKLGTYHLATSEHIQAAIENAKQSQATWMAMPWQERAAIFLRAADLLATKYRYVLNAATMLGQSKTAHQAEIDSSCELIDFWRFNVSYMAQIYNDQPPIQPRGIWNRLEHRPLEGFVFAVTPFNFTAIAGNLPTAPAMLGNVCVWKPASSSMLSTYYLMKILKEAGLPDGIINLVPGRGSEVGEIVLNHRDLAGVHFTGSTAVFNNMWETIGKNLGRKVYRSYPRIVGETGGKDFIFAYKDCDLDNLAVNIVRGAFEFQGQKCSAASRAYIPRSIWAEIKVRLGRMLEEIKVGDVCDFKNFMGAVIDEKSFDNIVSYIEYAKKSNEAQILWGGHCDKSKGFFVQPTIIETSNPKFKLMEEEIFGPVMCIHVYEDGKWEETARLLDETSPYALTGAIFATDRSVVGRLTDILRNAAGNFYINDKPTGAVVGQQPFGGSRASGTNDKAGSYLNLVRWINVRTIKENFVPVKDYRYPFLD